MLWCSPRSVRGSSLGVPSVRFARTGSVRSRRTLAEIAGKLLVFKADACRRRRQLDRPPPGTGNSGRSGEVSSGSSPQHARD